MAKRDDGVKITERREESRYPIVVYKPQGLDRSPSELYRDGKRVVREGKQAGRAIVRTGKLAKDVAAVATGKDRGKDRAGRTKMREWEKEWFKNAVATGAGIATVAAGKKVHSTAVRKTAQGAKGAWKAIADPMEAVVDAYRKLKTPKPKPKASGEKIIKHNFEAIDVRTDRGRRIARVADVRGNSLRLYTEGAKPRERRRKRPEERIEAERERHASDKVKIGTAAGVGGLALATGVGLLAHKLHVSKITKQHHEGLGKVAASIDARAAKASEKAVADYVAEQTAKRKASARQGKQTLAERTAKRKAEEDAQKREAIAALEKERLEQEAARSGPFRKVGLSSRVRATEFKARKEKEKEDPDKLKLAAPLLTATGIAGLGANVAVVRQGRRNIQINEEILRRTKDIAEANRTTADANKAMADAHEMKKDANRIYRGGKWVVAKAVESLPGKAGKWGRSVTGAIRKGGIKLSAKGHATRFESAAKLRKELKKERDASRASNTLTIGGSLDEVASAGALASLPWTQDAIKKVRAGKGGDVVREVARGAAGQAKKLVARKTTAGGRLSAAARLIAVPSYIAGTAATGMAGVGLVKDAIRSRRERKEAKA